MGSIARSSVSLFFPVGLKYIHVPQAATHCDDHVNCIFSVFPFRREMNISRDEILNADQNGLKRLFTHYRRGQTYSDNDIRGEELQRQDYTLAFDGRKKHIYRHAIFILL